MVGVAWDVGASTAGMFLCCSLGKLQSVVPPLASFRLTVFYLSQALGLMAASQHGNGRDNVNSPATTVVGVGL